MMKESLLDEQKGKTASKGDAQSIFEKMEKFAQSQGSIKGDKYKGKTALEIIAHIVEKSKWDDEEKSFIKGFAHNLELDIDVLKALAKKDELSDEDREILKNIQAKMIKNTINLVEGAVSFEKNFIESQNEKLLLAKEKDEIG